MLPSILLGAITAVVSGRVLEKKFPNTPFPLRLLQSGACSFVVVMIVNVIWN